MPLILLPFASDVSGLPPWTAYPAIFLLLTGIGWLVTASARGTITWPPEKKRMQDTIDMLTAALRDSNANAQRVLPTATRLVEVVEQRVVHPEPPPAKIDRDTLLAALREVTAETTEVAKGAVTDEQV